MYTNDCGAAVIPKSERTFTDSKTLTLPSSYAYAVLQPRKYSLYFLFLLPEVNFVFSHNAVGEADNRPTI